MRSTDPLSSPERKTRWPARRTLLCTLLCASLGGVQAATSDTDYVDRAKSYLQKGDLAAARLELKNAVQANPDNRDAHWLLGQVFIEQGQGELAEKEIEQARELGLSDAASQPTLVRAIYMQGDMDRVIEAARETAANLPPKDQALVLGFYGRALVEKRQTDNAHDVLDRALAIDPRSPDALTGMALLSISGKDRTAAHKWLDQALEADPTYADAWTLLGNLFLAEGDAKEAERAFDRAIDLRKYFNSDRAQRAMARLRLGNVAGAEADVQALKKAGFERHPLVSYAAGIVALKRRDLTTAAIELEVSYAARPNEKLALLLAATHLLLGHPDLVMFYQQKMTTTTGDAGRLLLTTAESIDPDFAVITPPLQSALEKSPNDPIILDLLGRLAMLRGDANQAVDYYRKLAEIQPESPTVGKALMLAELMGGGAIESLADTAVGAGSDKDNGDYDTAFLQALAEFRDRKYDNALAKADALARRFPERVDPINLVAACQLALGRMEPAKTALQRALKLRPNDPTARTNLAKITAASGQLQQARDLVEPVVQSNPKREDAVRLLAAIDASLRRQDAGGTSPEPLRDGWPRDRPALADRASQALADGHAAQALLLVRDLPQAELEKDSRLLGVKGRAELLTGDLKAANETLARWTEVDPNSAVARFYYAESLARSGAFGTASEQLNKAVALDPNNLLAGVGQVKALVALNQIDAANAALTGLKGRFGDAPEVLAVEGWLALGTGQYERATSRLAAAAEKKPTAEIAILRARALLAQSKKDDALAILRDWQEAHPKDLATLMELADAYLGSGREGDAKESYTKVLALAPDNVLALNNLAWLSRGENLNKSIDMAKQAYSLAPNQPQVIDTLGMLLIEAGDTGTGYRHIEHAAELAPEDPQIQLHWGKVLLEMGRSTEAKEILQGLATRTPNSAQGNDARALLQGSVTPIDSSPAR